MNRSQKSTNTKMKSSLFKRATLLALVIAVSMLTGCGGAKNVYPTDKQDVLTDEQDTNIAPTETQKASDYKQAYLAKVTEFINAYGEYGLDPETQAVTGLKYGELIDFEKDAIPEMLLVCDRTAYIFGFNGSEVVELLIAPIGSGFGQTDVSYYIYISEAGGDTYVIIDNTTDEWCEDNWVTYTVENGGVYELDYVARTDGYNDYPGTEFLTSFWINGEEVSADEYLQDRELLRGNSRSIDAIWDLSATYDELMDFEALLS